MGRTCTVCRHEKREEIDQALVTGTAPERTIARQYTVSRDALHRHRAHIPAEVSKAHHAKDIARADSLLASIVRIREKLETALEGAAVARDIAALAREARETLRLMAELEGRLRQTPQVAVTINLASSPEFLALVARVKLALLPYQEAYAAVVAELEGTKVSPPHRARPASAFSGRSGRACGRCGDGRRDGGRHMMRHKDIFPPHLPCREGIRVHHGVADRPRDYLCAALGQ